MYDIIGRKINCNNLKYAGYITFVNANEYIIAYGYSISDKLEWTVIFILEFGRRYGLNIKQSFNYLSRYKGINFIDRNYGFSSKENSNSRHTE